jgi:hypothetical protein
MFSSIVEPEVFSEKGGGFDGPSLAPPLGLNFKAFDFTNNGAVHGGFYFIPPDPIGAAGPEHLVNVGNVYIEWYDKATGFQQNQQALETFFAPLNPVNLHLFDPKVRYDQYEGRFVVVVLEQQDVTFGDPVNSSRILVAVSQTSDPNAGWWFHSINSFITIGGIPSWADYPGLGLDDKAIYITNNMFGFRSWGGPYTGQRLWIVHKNWYGGPNNSATVTVHDPFTQTGISGFATTAQPAHMYGTLPNGSTGLPLGTFIVSYSGLTQGGPGGIEFVNVIEVTNPIGAVTFNQQFVPCSDIEDVGGIFGFPPLPDAPQAGGPALIEVNDRRALDAVWRNNKLVLTSTIIPNAGPDAGHTTAHFWELNTAVPIPNLTCIQEANIGAEDLGNETYTFFPSCTVDHCSNIAIGFCASNSEIFCGAYYTGQNKTVDPPGTVQPTSTLKVGEAYYLRTFGGSRNRWGDYTGISLCPVDEITFWTYNQYAWQQGTPIGGQDGRWSTWWGEWRFNCPPVAVAITHFDAKVNGGGVELTSTFASNFDVLSVNIYRGHPDDEPLFFKSVEPSGGGLRFVDTDVQPGKSYAYRIGVTDRDGEFFSEIVTVDMPVGGIELGLNVPNPFNPKTSIVFMLPSLQHVQVDVYDAAGRFVTRLFDGTGRVGENRLEWDGTNAKGQRVVSGVYYYKLTAGKYTESRRMVLLK